MALRLRPLQVVGVVIFLIGLAWLIYDLTRSPLQTPPPGMTPSVSAPASPSVSPPAAVATPDITTAPVPAPIADPQGEPEWITVENQDGVPYISTGIVPNKLRANHDLVPPVGSAGWYAEAGWPRPGVVSDRRSVVVGHATCGLGCRDVFFNLRDVKVGDIVRIKYDSGETLSFRVFADWQSVSKNQFVKPVRDDGSRTDVYPAWFSEDGAPERVVTLATCDTDSGYSGGHSNNNGYTQALRCETPECDRLK